MNNWSLTHPQTRIWYTEKLHPNTSLGIISVSLRLISKQSTIAIPLLQQAVNELLHRNEVLRLRIVEEAGQPPKQYVSEYRAYDVPIIEANGMDISSWEKDKANVPMSWNDADLFEFYILRKQTSECILYQRFHHFIHDGISQQLIIDDILTYYSCLASETPLPDDNRPTYIQFINTEMQYEQSERWEKDRKYWLSQFENDSSSDKIFISTQQHDYSTASDRYSVPLSPYMQECVYQFCEHHQISIFTLFTALLGMYQYKWNGNQLQMMGTTLSNRTTKNEKQMLGMFVSTVPLRLHVHGTQDRLSFIKQVHKQQFSAARHQKYPFNQLVQELRMKTGDSSPLFRVSIEYRDTDTFNENGNELLQYEWEHIHCGHEENDFLLRIQRVTASNELFIHFDYKKALYSKEDIQRHMEQLIYTAEQVLTEPELSIDCAEICTPEQRRLFLTAFQTPADMKPISHRSVVQALNDQLTQTPDRVAIRCGGESVSYRELNARAEKLSSQLCSNGIGADHVVGILMERSVDMIISMLGIWKAGAAYMPLDPSLPKERITFMLADCNARLIVSHRGIGARAELEMKYECLDLFSCIAEGNFEYDSISCNTLEIAPSSLAYIIYTSGSTGNPKGVMIEHQSFSSILHHRSKEYGTGAEDTVLPMISFSFDGFVATCWTPLITGATVVLTTEEEMKDFEAIRRLIMQEKITHFIATPSLYGSLLPGLSAEDIASLRIVTLAGERVSDAVVANSQKLKSDIEIAIEYGPSENTVVTTIKRHAQSGGAYSIGKPIPNTSIYVLNEHLQLQPIGAQGQLCISGIGLARGYTNLPEQTELRFISNPFEQSDGSKHLYITGDYGKWLPNGEIEFIGRKDDQIKIRGYRIELSEIESRLQKLEAVREAVVIPVQQAAADVSLHAFVTITEQDCSDLDIRSQLFEQLPAYMVPAYVRKVDKLPLTPNGKIDRKQLLLMIGQSSEQQQFLEPVTECEQLLAKLWEEALHVHPIGLNHSFWELGGDSIKALQLAGRLHQHGYKLKAKDLHAYPTLREAAVRIKATKVDMQCELPVTGIVSFIPIQHWFWEQRFANPNHWNQSFVLFSEQCFVQEHIEHIFDHLVQHHDALRITYLTIDDTNVQRLRHLEEGPFYTLEIFDLRQYDNPIQEMEQCATRLQQSIDISEGPIVRLGLFRMKQGDHLLFTIHHLVVDGYSWRILLEDFADGYEQSINGEPLRLKPKTDSYQHWGRELSRYAQTEKVMQELPYWIQLEHIAGDPLPPSKINAAITDHYGFWSDNGSMTVEFSATDTGALLRKSNTPESPDAYELMLTAFGLALADWSGGRIFRLDAEGHGRESIGEDIDVSRTIGWFMSMYPIILEIPCTGQIFDAVERTRRMLHSIPNKGLNYGILKYLTNSDAACTPKLQTKSQINFNYMGQFGDELNKERFHLSSMPTGDPIGLDNARIYRLEAVAMIAGGKLLVRFVYNTREYEQSAIEELANRYKLRLLELIELQKHNCWQPTNLNC